VQKDLKAEPERVELEQGIQASIQKFKALLRQGGPEQKYELGIMGHAQKRGFGWKYPTSTLKATRSKQEVINDVEEMLANYHMKVLKTYNKELNDEPAAKLLTQASMNAKAMAKFERVKGLYKGKGEQLHRAHRWSSVYYRRDNKYIGYAYRTLSSNNLKHAFQTLAKNLFDRMFKRYVDVAWLITTYDRGVVACSEEKKMEDPICLKMLGYALYHKTFRRDRLDRKIVNPVMNPKSAKNFYYGIFADSAKPKEAPKFVNLTSNWGAAYNKYMKMCQVRKANPTEYNVCILGSTRVNYWWYAKTRLTGTEIRHDVYLLLAKYHVEKFKDIFSKVKTDEATLKIKTRVEWAAYLKENLDKIKKSYTGDTSPLFRARLFSLVAINKFNNMKYTRKNNIRSANVRYAVNTLAGYAINSYFKNEDAKVIYAWAIISQDGGPIYVSEDIKGRNMQRLLGNCIIWNWMFAPKELTDMTRGIAHDSEGYHYFALLSDEKGEVTKMDLAKVVGTARAQFNGLFPANKNLWKYTHGIMGHTGVYGWRTHAGQSAEPTNSEKRIYDDVRLLPMQFIQKNLTKYVEVKSDVAGLGLETRKEVNERVKESYAKAQKFWNGVSNDRLQTGYYISIIHFAPRQNSLSAGVGQSSYNFRATIKYLYTWMHNSHIKNKSIERKVEYMIVARLEGGIIYSSIDDLKDEKNKIMIGYALQTRRMYLPEKLVHAREQHRLSKTKGWTIVAIK